MRSRSDEPDTLTESAFDRELKEALDIDPSPEFLARVRTRLASEPEPSAWRFPWLIPAAGLGAIVVAAVVVTSQRDPVVVQTFGSADPDPIAVQTFRSAETDPGVAQTFRSAVADSKPLEVIISPDEVRGLRRLIAMAAEEDANLESLLAGPTILATVGPEGEITLPPITIEPILPETDSDTQ